MHSIFPIPSSTILLLPFNNIGKVIICTYNVNIYPNMSYCVLYERIILAYSDCVTEMRSMNSKWYDIKIVILLSS